MRIAQNQAEASSSSHIYSSIAAEFHFSRPVSVSGCEGKSFGHSHVYSTSVRSCSIVKRYYHCSVNKALNCEINAEEEEKEEKNQIIEISLCLTQLHVLGVGINTEEADNQSGRFAATHGISFHFLSS